MTDATTAPATIQVQGITLRLADVLNVEAKLAESWVRNGFFLVTGLLCPILSMILFTLLEGPTMWAAGLATAAGPFLGMAVSLVWKKPWGVVVELPERYRTIWQTGSKTEAERVAGEIRSAISA